MSTLNNSSVTLEDVQKKANSIGLRIPEILLPCSAVDLQKYAVIACDQYTSEPEYWQQVKHIVGDSISTLHLTLPEIYLEHPDKDARIQRIHAHMREYLQRGDLVSQPPGMVLVKRTLPSGLVRTGVVLAIDLEIYEYRPGNSAPCRATEKTIEARIPPRLEVRKDALIELPHVLILIDDRKKQVIESLGQSCGSVLYDFDLMANSGHLQGRLITDTGVLDKFFDALGGLRQPDSMLFAVGDGNHSLATAKTHWENVKRKLSLTFDQLDHPARYALVEIQNLHADSLHFEPIHRMLWNCDSDVLLSNFLAQTKADIRWDDKAFDQVSQSTDQSAIGVVISAPDGKRKGVVIFSTPRKALALSVLTEFLDGHVKEHAQIGIDYVHGMGAINKLKQGISFVLPNINKTELFGIIQIDGILPRKTFSMGSADEKRFYLEAKRITYSN